MYYKNLIYGTINLWAQSNNVPNKPYVRYNEPNIWYNSLNKRNIRYNVLNKRDIRYNVQCTMYNWNMIQYSI